MTVNDFIAGWASGGSGLIFGHPLDTIKARLQTSNQYSGIIDCFQKTVAKEGFNGFYKGLAFPFLSAGCLYSLLFAGYGTTLHLLHPDDVDVERRKDLPLHEIILASIVGTWCQIIPAIPVELIKTKLQVQEENYSTKSASSYKGPVDCAKQLLRKNGLKGLYQGGSMMLYRDNIGYLFYLPIYESIKKMLSARGANDTVVQFIAGGCAGSAGWLSICPFEVVKSRLQTTREGHKTLYVIAEIWREGRVLAFYKGGLTLAIRGFPTNAIIFVVYENTLSYLEKKSEF